MKKTILTFALALTAIAGANAQDFRGMVVYETKIDVSDFKSRIQSNSQITPEMQQLIEERMKKMSEKTFVLNFDKEASVYKEEEKLDAPGQQTNGGFRMMMSSMSGLGNTFYKNIKAKTYTVDKEFLGKEFLVIDSLPKLDWKITGESRKIGDYMCIKATAVKPVSKSDFRNMRFKPEDKSADKKKEDEQKKTNFMDQMEMAKEVTITAWFTPQIPVGQGPENYWGLPGLILEANDGKTTILCSKLVLNPKDKAEIKAPTKGEKVSQVKFDEIVTKKMEEQRQMGHGRNGMMMHRMSR